MMKVEKNVLVAHTAEQMFQLVDTIRDYPKFLPWCSQAIEIERTDNEVEASLHMDYMRIRQQFTTRNHNVLNEHIHMKLVDGPFRHLEGQWHFTPLGDFGCKIEFTLDYEFANPFLSKLIGPVFSKISGTLVDAFIKEADRRYD
ncbi:MAG: type II toxin-antitoxin system RatA family toxin [Neisseriaceae bacterium]|nr:type II toxin-antitoxin system RatA family toxin [Neisseriaceae bacterium]MBP6861028.1 type II toxin-antitoxin system RatA family toxin [Neisseriaceae bacterium]